MAHPVSRRKVSIILPCVVSVVFMSLVLLTKLGLAAYGSALTAGPSAPLAARIPVVVAIYEWVPEAASALRRLEASFEREYPEVDLQPELWDPYGDGVAVTEDLVRAMQAYDVAEIDVVRLAELLPQETGAVALDALPQSLRLPAGEYLPAARRVVDSVGGGYVVPHWACGNFLVFWAGGPLEHAKSFQQVITALDPAHAAPLFVDLDGSQTLGGYYADAVLDLRGEAKAREHLLALAASQIPPQLDETAAAAVVALAAEMMPEQRQHRTYFHNYPCVYPRAFAHTPKGALLGYSERLYYTQRELQLQPERGRPEAPTIAREELRVREFPFGKASAGSVAWVDGFVIPRGKLAPKEKAIADFIRFATSEQGYLAFLQPSPDLPATYLLPAHRNGYTAAIVALQPAITMYREALDRPFPIDDNRLWQGLRKAGRALRDRLKKDYPVQ